MPILLTNMESAKSAGGGGGEDEGRGWGGKTRFFYIGYELALTFDVKSFFPERRAANFQIFCYYIPGILYI